MIRTFQNRIAGGLVLGAVLFVMAAAAPAAFGTEPQNEPQAAAGGEAAETAEAVDKSPEEGSTEWADGIAARFADLGGWETEFVLDGKGDPEAVRVFLPTPLKSADAGPGEPVETVLPLQPPGHVARFKKIPFDDGVDGKVAFRHADFGWNTGGSGDDDRPRIDILFHTASLEDIAALEACAADAADCKAPSSDKEIARRLADRPPNCFLPDGSVPVADNATPQTGLFNLASGPDSGPQVPDIIYGTYDDEIVFLGVSLTLETLQRAVDEGVLGDRLSWPVSQPARYKFAWWPRTVALEYREDQARFALSLEDFSKRRVESGC